MSDEKMYVIQNNKTREWIGVDPGSGGYPYDTELKNAKIFYSVKDAEKYKNVIKADWSLFSLEMNVVAEFWENEA